MAFSNPPDDELRRLLTEAKTIAVVGASSKPWRSSHGIASKLISVGYDVYPVNPNETEVLGRQAYPTLADVPVPIDVVDVFRREEETPEIADQAVAVGAKVLWLQSGLWSEEAAARARAGGLVVVMDSCLGVAHSLLGVPPKART